MMHRCCWNNTAISGALPAQILVPAQHLVPQPFPTNRLVVHLHCLHLGSAQDSRAAGRGAGAFVPSGYHLRAKQKARADNDPLGLFSARATRALAMFDIHKRRGFAFPAIGRDVFPTALRRDHQRRGCRAHGTAHPSACCHCQFTTTSHGLQSLCLHFYTPCPIIKSGFKSKNY